MQGICAHVDLMRFEDGIAIVSLESSCVMHFTRVEGGSDIVEHGERHPLIRKVPVLLTPGSLVLMSGEARYLWKHEINRKPGIQMWEGQELIQDRRISLTLRKLCQVDYLPSFFFYSSIYLSNRHHSWDCSIHLLFILSLSVCQLECREVICPVLNVVVS